MRRFFYDTEFVERPHTIDLISIGIINEAGYDEFYGINTDCDYSLANSWVKKNVIENIDRWRGTSPGNFTRFKDESHSKGERNPVIKEYRESKYMLSKAILHWLELSEEDPIQLWSYYADFDHVAFSWLFGPMIDLPKGIKMYTMDLKQLAEHLGNPEIPKQEFNEHNALEDARWNRDTYFFLKRHAEENGYNLVI